MYLQVAGAVFGVEALSSRHFCPRGPRMGFSPALHFLLGTRKRKESYLSLSWCLGGELRAGDGAAVGLLGRGWCGYVSALDVVLVTCYRY